MRIEHLAFERYGIFADCKLSFDPVAALHVVLGANEAGKRRRCRRSAICCSGSEREPIMISGMTASCCGSAAASFIPMAGQLRHGGASNKNTLVDDSDQPLPDDAPCGDPRRLSRDAFHREFGLTTKALREAAKIC